MPSAPSTPYPQRPNPAFNDFRVRPQYAADGRSYDLLNAPVFAPDEVLKAVADLQPRYILSDPTSRSIQIDELGLAPPAGPNDPFGVTVGSWIQKWVFGDADGNADGVHNRNWGVFYFPAQNALVAMGIHEAMFHPPSTFLAQTIALPQNAFPGTQEFKDLQAQGLKVGPMGASSKLAVVLAATGVFVSAVVLQAAFEGEQS